MRPRAGTQSWLILESYGLASEHGLTSDEAGTKANLLHTGYWKRCSDLYRAGFIMTVLDDEGRPVVRKGLSGSGQEVRKITSKGRSWLAVNA